MMDGFDAGLYLIRTNRLDKKGVVANRGKRRKNLKKQFSLGQARFLS